MKSFSLTSSLIALTLFVCVAADAQNVKKGPSFACKDSMEVFLQKAGRPLYMDRVVTLQGPSNVRDLGGIVVKGKKCIKKGRVYRGDNLEQTTAQDKEILVNEYKIRTDLDLRGDGQTSSPLGDKVQYVSHAFPWYTGGPDGVEGNKHGNIAPVIRLFADKDNYPVYYHCAIGRDRTGTLTVILMGLCGVSREEIEVDYRTSFYTYSGTLDKTGQDFMVDNLLTPLMNLLGSYGGATTFQEGVENYVLDLGITRKEIKKIRHLLGGRK